MGPAVSSASDLEWFVHSGDPCADCPIGSGSLGPLEETAGREMQP
jgi:hypothetical protein